MKHSLISLFCLSLVAIGGRADDGIPVKILKDIKNATVLVRAESGSGGQQSGSGFVMKVAGDAVWIVTNHHVVDLTPEFNPRPFPGPIRLRPVVDKGVFTVVFRSGTKEEQVIRAELLAADSQVDLAILKVTGVKELPRPLDLERPAALVETMAVYTFGFPFGKALATSKGHPAITVGKGTVSSIRRNDKDEIAVVQIDGALNPGNSGGPVVDSQGRLVGVAVASIRAANIGFAIPPRELTQLLAGRLGKASFSTRLDKGMAEVRVAIRLVDPLAKIKAVKFYFLPAELAKKLATTGKANMAQLSEARQLEMKIDRQDAVASFQLTLNEKPGETITWQAVYVTGEGKQVANEPKSVLVGRQASPLSPFTQTAGQPLTAQELDQVLADLKGTDQFRRQIAVRQLSRAEPNERRAEVAKKLEAFVNDNNLFIRQEVLKALIAWGTREQVPTLLQVLKEKSLHSTVLRQRALEALAQIKDEQTAEAVADCLVELGTRFQASRALLALGSKAEKAVLKMLMHQDRFVRWEAGKLLKEMGTAESVPALQKLAAQNDALEANWARDALEAIARRAK